MIELCIASTSAVVEPSTTASTTTKFARFPGKTAFQTSLATAEHRWARCSGCCCRQKRALSDATGTGINNATNHNSTRFEQIIGQLPAMVAGVIAALKTVVNVVRSEAAVSLELTIVVVTAKQPGPCMA